MIPWNKSTNCYGSMKSTLTSLTLAFTVSGAPLAFAQDKKAEPEPSYTHITNVTIF